MLRAASAFWRQAYTDLGVADLTAIAHDAITLGRSTPDDWISDLLPERDLLWEGCPDDFVVKRSGCLVALEELASTVTPTRRGDVLLECVEALLAVDTGAPITP